MAKASFDDYISIVESGQTKTASLLSSADSGILAKLAEELDGAGAPAAEGQVAPAASMIAGANPVVVGQTEAVQAAQLALAGGNAQEAAAGEIPAQAKPNMIGISAGDGELVDVNTLGRTPMAAAAAVSEEEKTASLLGETMANAFLDGIVKQAEQGEYEEATMLLKEAGLLDGYDIVDDYMDKTAGQQDYSALQKIASNEVLTREDMVKAASEYAVLAQEETEYAEMAKEAEDYGRALAWEYAEGLQAEQEDMAKEASDVQALMGDQDVVNAVSVLKSRGLI